MSLYTRKSEKYESSDSMASPPGLDFTLAIRKEIGIKMRFDWSSNEIQSQLPTEILLITVNDHEFDACYSHMKHVQRSWCDTLGMVDFGQFGGENVKVALMKCTQGPSSAVIAVKNAADILYPKVVLFVGTCASMKPTKAKLGDVVISAKLATHGNKKVRADGIVEYRGVKVDVSRNMARLIPHAADGWVPPLKDHSSLKVEVHRDAVMLSGPELVDNLERRQELLNYFRDALGLEMEGAGLYAAARDLGIEWVVIKAVSDFGDGSKTATEDWQPFASVMAASVVYNMFKYRDVIKQWPHYKNAQTASLVVRADVVSTPPRPLREDQSARRTNCSIDEFIQRASFGDSGQCQFKGRMIKYEVVRRLPYILTESWSWKFEATATDKTTNITMKKGIFPEKDKAVKYTIEALLEKLQELNYLD